LSTIGIINILTSNFESTRQNTHGKANFTCLDTEAVPHQRTLHQTKYIAATKSLVVIQEEGTNAIV